MKRYALITGASRGIGRAIAIELAKDGCSILLNYKSNHAAAQEAKRLIEEAGGEAELLPFDVSQPDAINAALDAWFAAHPDDYIDVLVNNAGIVDDEIMLMMEPEQWHRVIDVNLNGFFYCTRRVIEGMVINHHGRIINVSSISGQVGNVGQINYVASKSAIIGVTKTLAKELAAKRITVNAVSPGAIETDMVHASAEYMPKWMRDLNNIPMRRLGKPEEVAYLVSFLCSDRADYISGQVIGINGAAI
ncbi:MAG: 3-oxoacyl-ACP reductase FabG [Paludibacteraceae bacterium]|nr:3-oxoacyl-ACP reductase FabG [Paludibacteraceae bacterium]